MSRTYTTINHVSGTVLIYINSFNSHDAPSDAGTIIISVLEIRDIEAHNVKKTC